MVRRACPEFVEGLTEKVRSGKVYDETATTPLSSMTLISWVPPNSEVAFTGTTTDTDHLPLLSMLMG